MANTFGIVCPAECEDALTLPVLPATLCQLAPKKSEIDVLIFQGTDDGPVAMGTAGDWTGLILNTDATGAKMKYLIGVGSIAEPEETVATVARGKEIVTNKARTLVFTGYELTEDSIYDFVRTLECGSSTNKFFFTDRGGFLYGKKQPTTTPDEGITPDSIKANIVWDAGNESILKYVITIKFSAQTSPDRVINPLVLE